ncbi:hypothetical protein A4X06_0g8362 [Tilletia controversa]|uniref:Uncharacterized protein n=1 Tax=Tilletia controversa TaxID=13291 RepID=A0A8X7STC1_9BASI|nr:hypothetical protein A4X06_0g8362 [Tilletia controversa]
MSPPSVHRSIRPDHFRTTQTTRSSEHRQQRRSRRILWIRQPSLLATREADLQRFLPEWTVNGWIGPSTTHSTPTGHSTALSHPAHKPQPCATATRSRHPTVTSATHTLPSRLALHASSSMPHSLCATGYSDVVSEGSKFKIIESTLRGKGEQFANGH